MIYIAYGSNLNKEQMVYRCPSAKYLGKGTLKDYKLEFNRHLNVTPSEGDSVPVGLWLIDSIRDWRALDVYEGCPVYYKKQSVEFLDDKGVKKTGMVYIMNQKFRRLCPPAQGYFQVCRKGYQDCSLDLSVLEKAYDESMEVGGIHVR